MFIQPIYNILLLPNVTYFFKKDFFEDRGSELKTDTELLFVMLKNETDSDGFKADDFYPIGVSARVENISDEDVIQIRTLDRVEILDPVIEDGDVRASFVVRPCVERRTAECIRRSARRPAPFRPGLPVGPVGAGVHSPAEECQRHGFIPV